MNRKNQSGTGPIIILIILALSAVTTVVVLKEVSKKDSVADTRIFATTCTQSNGTPLSFGREISTREISKFQRNINDISTRRVDEFQPDGRRVDEFQRISTNFNPTNFDEFQPDG